ncbi:MAG: hypothetical protein QMD04_07850 [Anaerolineales bacterium]|nr:hypothetical protein [Anaerolineales bacterium]
MRTALFRLLSLALALALLTACAPAATETVTPPTSLPPSATPAPPTDTPLPPTATPSPTNAPPPEPVAVTFTTEDGVALNGMYYPAAITSAPVVVLIHWVAGDLHDWDAIAPWLQKSKPQASLGWSDAAVSRRPQTVSGPWLDPSWFPPVPPDLNVAVFTFTLRGCEGGKGCKSWDPIDWLKDTQAAFQTAAGLPGVDPSRITAMGASIGADAAPDGCYLHNKAGGSCLGAIALSPGSYLGMNFKQVVADMEKEFPATAIWCFAATGDRDSYPTCNNASGANYKTFIGEGMEHGMTMIQPGYEPKVLDLTLEFLQTVFAP